MRKEQYFLFKSRQEEIKTITERNTHKVSSSTNNLIHIKQRQNNFSRHLYEDKGLETKPDAIAMANRPGQSHVAPKYSIRVPKAKRKSIVR
jgi:hypothetical protein